MFPHDANGLNSPLLEPTAQHLGRIQLRTRSPDRKERIAEPAVPYIACRGVRSRLPFPLSPIGRRRGEGVAKREDSRESARSHSFLPRAGSRSVVRAPSSARGRWRAVNAGFRVRSYVAREWRQDLNAELSLEPPASRSQSPSLVGASPGRTGQLQRGNLKACPRLDPTENSSCGCRL